MSQTFTPSTNGSNLSIAAGTVPEFVERRRGQQWRADAVLRVATLAELRLKQVVDADTFLVGGLGAYEWDGASTETDDGTETSNAVAVTGVTVGRYRKLQRLSPSLTSTVEGDVATISAVPNVYGNHAVARRLLDSLTPEKKVTLIQLGDSRSTSPMCWRS